MIVLPVDGQTWTSPLISTNHKLLLCRRFKFLKPTVCSIYPVSGRRYRLCCYETMSDQERGSATARGLKDLLRKVDGTILPVIEEHVQSTEFNADKDGLDFLAVKNSLLLSYLIDLTFHYSQTLQGKAGSIKRLTEMKIALEKSRPLEKKMRYQLDKLLSNGNSSAFATAGEQQDPLSFRPNPDALKDEEQDRGLSSDDDDSDDSDDNSNDENDDDDLAAATKILKLAGDRKARKGDDGADGVYRAPRIAAVPYPSDGVDPGEKQKRLHKRLRTTELARTLRDQYGDAPEQEDMHGGAEYGKQREAARRLTEMEHEKTRFEEDNMIRLTTSRKHKKERQKLMRAESSNLGAISDLGNLTRSVTAAFDKKPIRSSGDGVDMDEGGTKKKKRRAGVQANSLQKALFGVSGSNDGSKAKKTKTKRR
jgi:U3 small nucleolar ribonucleoprotein protein LCP5